MDLLTHPIPFHAIPSLTRQTGLSSLSLPVNSLWMPHAFAQLLAGSGSSLLGFPNLARVDLGHNPNVDGPQVAAHMRQPPYTLRLVLDESLACFEQLSRRVRAFNYWPTTFLSMPE